MSAVSLNASKSIAGIHEATSNGNHSTIAENNNPATPQTVFATQLGSIGARPQPPTGHIVGGWAVLVVGLPHNTSILHDPTLPYHLYMQLRGVMLYVKDLERMKRFYGDVLGVEATNQNWTNAWAVFDTGDVRFALHAVPTGIAENIEIACPPVPREQEPVKLIFEVKDVEGERERLELLGVQMLRRPWQQSGEACDAVDPEGNIFQLCSTGADPLR